MTETFAIHVADEEATANFGTELAKALDGRGSIHIRGHLGAGKTTLCRSILRGMGHEGAVKSPTFTLVEPYETDDYTVFHFDLYRLSDPNELDYIGIDEYFREDCLCLIEWPERAEGHLPHHDLVIELEGKGSERTISLKSNSTHGDKVCRELEKHTVSRSASG